MTFPTVLNWDHRLFEVLLGAQTIWYPCPAESWVMSAHSKGNTFWVTSAFHFPQSDGLHLDELIDLCQLRFILSYFSVYVIQLWLWFTGGTCLAFSSTWSSLCKLSFTSWCPQLPSIKNCLHKREFSHCGELSEWVDLGKKIKSISLIILLVLVLILDTSDLEKLVKNAKGNILIKYHKYYYVLDSERQYTLNTIQVHSGSWIAHSATLNLGGFDVFIFSLWQICIQIFIVKKV